MKLNELYDILDNIIPNPMCELEYNKDYELLIAVMLSAQTTDKRVNLVTKELFSKYPTLESLCAADINDLTNIIRPIGTFHKKANNVKEIAKRLLEEQNGVVPNNRTYLESLPGVGRKTTNVVLNVWFNQPTLEVDTHVMRISTRLGFSKGKTPLAIEKDLLKVLPEKYVIKANHWMVLFGRYTCKAQKPLCSSCPISNYCTSKDKML